MPHQLKRPSPVAAAATSPRLGNCVSVRPWAYLLMPTPRNDSVVSRITAPEVITLAATTIGRSEFGRMWRRMIRTSLAPIARAASTNSRSRSESVVLRAMRAIGIQSSAAKSSEGWNSVFTWRYVAATRMVIKGGSVSSRSVNRIRTLSTRRRRSRRKRLLRCRAPFRKTRRAGRFPLPSRSRRGRG